MRATSDHSHDDPFGPLFATSPNKFGLCTLIVLAWIASSDGTIDADERGLLAELGQSWRQGPHTARVLELMPQISESSLAVAFRALRFMDAHMRIPFVELALGVALADGRLTPGESHIIRLIADVLGVTPGQLDAAFNRLTDSPLPTPADLSSRHWWASKEAQGRQTDDRREQRTAGRAPPAGAAAGPDLRRLRALAMLGLDDDAAENDIRAAYRRMAKIHHPDRYASLGEEAVQAAETTFRRIKEAHDFLTGA